jgi:sugar lactone lactonase YvrE
VVNVASGKVERSYALGKKIHGLDIGDDGKTLFVSDQIGNKLIALDPESGATRSIELTPALYHLGVIRGTGKVYVSSRDKPLIWVVDQKRMVVVNTIALPAGEGHQIALVH